MTTTQLIYEAAGAPPMLRDASDTCRTCGRVAVGTDFDAWVRPTFTDWGLLTGGSVICEACQFCFEDANAELARRVGKEGTQKPRNYSHFVVAGDWRPMTKGNKPQMIECLNSSPQVAVIADGGQKHIIFRAKPGWWQFEELSMRPNPIVLNGLIAAMIPALAIFAKSELESGRYSFSRIEQFGLFAYQMLEAGLRLHRGSAIFALALFLAQKEEVDGDQ